MVDNERSEGQPMPRLKRANGTTETAVMQSAAGMVYVESARNAVCGFPKREQGVSVGSSLMSVREGARIGVHSFLKI